MDFLIRLGESALPDFSDVLNFDAVTGISVSSDPLLRRLWAVYTTMTEDQWGNFERSFADALHRHDHLGWPGPGTSEQRLNELLDNWEERDEIITASAPTEIDPYWTCGLYELVRPERIRSTNGSNVVFTVSYDSLTPPSTMRDIAGLVGQIPWPVRLSPRPPARLQSSAPIRDSREVRLGPGASIGPRTVGNSGTLGGSLTVNQKEYGVTCGHVLPVDSMVVHPSIPDGGYDPAIGRCCVSTAGTLVGAGQRCSGEGPTNRHDVALVLLEGHAEFDRLGDTVSETSGFLLRSEVVEDRILRLSARSGKRNLRVAGVSLRRSFIVDESRYCFSNLLELRRPTRAWAIHGYFAKPSRPGDSGAWLVAGDDEAAKWAGMITGGDNAVSYAQFAQDVMDWARCQNV